MMCNRLECDGTFYVIQPNPPTVLDPPWSRTSRLHLKLAERDGELCHYCGVHLVLPGQESKIATWVPGVAYVNHCGCGLHQPGELCRRGGHWALPKGHAWPTIDHKIPRAAGGDGDMGNLVLACATCNSKKGTRPYEEMVR